MSIEINMLINIHDLMYHSSISTYSMPIDIHGVYVNRHTVCRSTYFMSVDILYVNRLLPRTVTFALFKAYILLSQRYFLFCIDDQRFNVTFRHKYNFIHTVLLFNMLKRHMIRHRIYMLRFAFFMQCNL